jgi:hypothetical protein|tara:strand:- start:46 stop:300 length:255 start_codon:yes stop_codon:yes gene_type:complete
MSKDIKKEKVWADGFSFKRREGAPDFVIGEINVKVEDAIKTLEQNKNEKGWVKLKMAYSSQGNPYVEVDTWKPPAEKEENPLPF